MTGTAATRKGHEQQVMHPDAEAQATDQTPEGGTPGAAGGHRHGIVHRHRSIDHGHRRSPGKLRPWSLEWSIALRTRPPAKAVA
jgi:hypothetical protein